jgi:hypothetical protein
VRRIPAWYCSRKNRGMERRIVAIPQLPLMATGTDGCFTPHPWISASRIARRGLIAATSLTESILVDELSKTRRGKGRGRMLVLSGVAPLPLMACINGRLTQAHRRVGHPAACLPRSTSSPSASAHGIGARQPDRSIWRSA